jgi:hypothetical protein
MTKPKKGGGDRLHRYINSRSGVIQSRVDASRIGQDFSNRKRSKIEQLKKNDKQL